MTKPVLLQHFQIAQRPDGSLWELGHGAMGITYRATDMELGGTVALKVINTTYLHNARARERFLREARSAAYLNHPNIASVFHLGREGDNFFYAMEFVEGETLEAFIARLGPVHPRLALRMVQQVAQGLAVANDRGLIHRDIKPANLMVIRHEVSSEDEDELLVKVIDFGLAKSSQQEENNISLTGGSPVGTPAYMSPEQIEPTETGIDARSDIYSLGATLWCLLTGTPPFAGTPFNVLNQHLQTPPPVDRLRSTGTPEGIIALLGRMLAKKPDERPASHREVISQIKILLKSLPAPVAVGAHDSTVTLAMPMDGDSSAPGNHTASSVSEPRVAPTIGFSLLEVLRCRGSLPTSEVLRLLEILAAEVDVARHEGPLELKPEAVQIRFELPADLDHLPHQPVSSWPWFAFLLRPRAEDAVQMTMTVEQTILSEDPLVKGADDLARLAMLVYELLAGRPPVGLVRYQPVPSLGEAGNDVLSRCLRPPTAGSHLFDSAVAFWRMLTDAVQASGVLYSHPTAVHATAHPAGHPSTEHHSSGTAHPAPAAAPHHATLRAQSSPATGVSVASAIGSPIAAGPPTRAAGSLAQGPMDVPIPTMTGLASGLTHASAPFGTSAGSTPGMMGSPPVVIHQKTPAIVWVLIALLVAAVGAMFWRETLRQQPVAVVAPPATTPAPVPTAAPAATPSADQVHQQQLQQEEERQEQMLAAQEAHAKAVRTIRVPSEYRSIQAAIDAAESGDTVQVSSGRYPEAIRLKEGVRLIGSSRDKVHVITNANLSAFTAENCRFGSVTEISFEQTPGSSTATLQPAVAIKSSAIQFVHCRVHNSAVYGIYIRGTDHSRIEGCEVTGAGSDGIHVMDEGAVPTIKGNHVENNQMNGIFFHMLGGGTVEGNIVQHNGGSGIAMMGPGVSPSLDGNEFTGNKKWGIEIGKPATPKIKPNNVTSGNAFGPSYESDVMEKM